MKTEKVVSYFGSKTAVADALTGAGFPCTKSAVSQWGDKVPPLRVYQFREHWPDLVRMESGEAAA